MISSKGFIFIPSLTSSTLSTTRVASDALSTTLVAFEASLALSTAFATFDASLTLSSAFKPLPANFPPFTTLLIPKEAKPAINHPAASKRLAASPVSGSFPVIRRYVSLTEKNSPSK